MKYCIVQKVNGQWRAWDEHARLIAHRQHWPDLMDLLDQFGYERVSSKTRFGATILDKLNLRSVGEAIVSQLLSK